jgi:hypothetical protein
LRKPALNPTFGRTSRRSAVEGQGQAVFGHAPAQPKTEHRLMVYQHFVTTPVAIGAATNPTAMLNPLLVKVQ